MVRNPPSKAGEAGLTSGWGNKIVHAAGATESVSPTGQALQQDMPKHHNEDSAQPKKQQKKGGLSLNLGFVWGLSPSLWVQVLI